tara:strand:+ start:1163 stop:2161 length:999 start_codon:yes stop_codon:yes gene_type:complete
MSTIIIAEAGVNHNGSIKIARELIDVAADAGADFVKFQTFKAETLATPKADKAIYQKRLTDKDESHFEMIKKLELDKADHKKLIDYSKKKNINFLSTAFDIESLNFLTDLNIPLYKIPSGEVTNLPYLRHVGGMHKPIIMSTGMCTIEEICFAFNILLEAGMRREDITILHCNTEYPTPMHDVNLKAMDTIRTKLGVKVGYSDHTLGIEIPIAAVALGASVIEKHFTLDRNLKGPDHAASLEPNELKNMVDAIRGIEKALGDGIKKPSLSEKKNIPIARKSIVASQPIKKGDLFSEDNLTVKRPGTGISPMKWDAVLGKNASCNYKKDDLIS